MNSSYSVAEKNLKILQIFNTIIYDLELKCQIAFKSVFLKIILSLGQRLLKLEWIK